MEGYLFKKGRGESKIFGRKNWKKRWFILEGQYLTYYDDFDLEKKIPINKKGVAIIGGCEITIVPHQERKFCFVVKHAERNPLFLCAEKEKLMHVWIKALINAANGVGGPTTFNFDEYYELLSLDKSEELTTSSLNKAYRKAALKNHPDKGGNVDAFKRVQEAFEILQAKLLEEEQSKFYKTIGFSAEIEKGPQNVGFGMTVVEDTKKGAIIVKDVFPTMILRSISEESGGKLEKGDRIIGLDNDDIRTWTLARVVQRLTDIRAPVGVLVTFTFSRQVRIDGGDENDEFEQQGADEEEQRDGRNKESQEDQGDVDSDPGKPYRGRSVSSEYASADIDEDDASIPSHSQEKYYQRSSVYSDYASADIDEDDFIPPPPQQQQQQQRSSVFSDYGCADIDEDDYVPPPQPEVKTQKPFNSTPPTASQSQPAIPPPSQPSVSKAWQIDPMVEVVTLRAENEDMQTELERLNRLLATVTKERDSFRQEANDYRMKYESAESERIEFLKQLSEVEIECQHLEQREKDALQLLEKLSEQGRLSIQQSAEIENNIRMGAKAAQSGELYSNFDQEQNYDSIKLAETAAFRSVSYVDPTGHHQEKFAQHDLGKNFLMKLESSVARQYGNSSAYESHTSPQQHNDDHASSYPSFERSPIDQQQSRPQRTRETINIPHPQRNGTQLYQSHKKNLKPVNRPSMAQRNNEESLPPPGTQPRHGGGSTRHSSKSQLHSPIKTHRATVSTSEIYESTRNHRTSGSGATDSRFQHLLQPTASSSNRISRQSNIRSNGDAEGEEPQGTGRTRSPRRHTEYQGRPSRGAFD